MSDEATGEPAAPPPIKAVTRDRAERLAPTIYDIARLAGVNPSTVSRALSKPGRISAKTEARIRDAAKQLNYKVNPMARALPTGRTKTIGLIVADFTNPVFFNIVRGAEKAATQHDFTLLLAESVESAENELRVAERLMRTADGLILATSRLSDDQIQELADQKPVIVINREVDGVPSVVPDVDYGIAEAVRHLSALGHRAITYVSGPSRSWMSERRWQSLKQRCEWANIAIQRTDPGIPTLNGGRKAAVALRDGVSTAAVAYNDLMAIGLMQELITAGVSIPGDLSIIGFDDIFGSDFTTPPLTTITSPLSDIGALAFSAFLVDREKAKGAGSRPADVASVEALPTRLIIRGSTGVPRSS